MSDTQGPALTVEIYRIPLYPRAAFWRGLWRRLNGRCGRHDFVIDADGECAGCWSDWAHYEGGMEVWTDAGGHQCSRDVKPWRIRRRWW